MNFSKSDKMRKSQSIRQISPNKVGDSIRGKFSNTGQAPELNISIMNGAI